MCKVKGTTRSENNRQLYSFFGATTVLASSCWLFWSFAGFSTGVKALIEPQSTTCPVPNNRHSRRPAGEHGGAFSSYRATCFPQELVETKNRTKREGILKFTLAPLIKTFALQSFLLKFAVWTSDILTLFYSFICILVEFDVFFWFLFCFFAFFVIIAL